VSVCASMISSGESHGEGDVGWEETKKNSRKQKKISILQQILQQIFKYGPPDNRGGLHLFYYGVATISRRLQIIGLFCKRALLKRRYSAKQTYKFKEPTYQSHPI